VPAVMAGAICRHDQVRRDRPGSLMCPELAHGRGVRGLVGPALRPDSGIHHRRDGGRCTEKRLPRVGADPLSSGCQGAGRGRPGDSAPVDPEARLTRKAEPCSHGRWPRYGHRPKCVPISWRMRVGDPAPLHQQTPIGHNPKAPAIIRIIGDMRTG
jgi:hypothetical protein